MLTKMLSSLFTKILWIGRIAVLPVLVGATFYERGHVSRIVRYHNEASYGRRGIEFKSAGGEQR